LWVRPLPVEFLFASCPYLNFAPAILPYADVFDAVYEEQEVCSSDIGYLKHLSFLTVSRTGTISQVLLAALLSGINPPDSVAALSANHQVSTPVPGNYFSVLRMRSWQQQEPPSDAALRHAESFPPCERSLYHFCVRANDTRCNKVAWLHATQPPTYHLPHTLPQATGVPPSAL
jgi:hypothetical protein